jgi:hypothetical protein
MRISFDTWQLVTRFVSEKDYPTRFPLQGVKGLLTHPIHPCFRIPLRGTLLQLGPEFY